MVSCTGDWEMILPKVSDVFSVWGTSSLGRPIDAEDTHGHACIHPVIQSRYREYSLWSRLLKAHVEHFPCIYTCSSKSRSNRWHICCSTRQRIESCTYIYLKPSTKNLNDRRLIVLISRSNYLFFEGISLSDCRCPAVRSAKWLWPLFPPRPLDLFYGDRWQKGKFKTLNKTVHFKYDPILTDFSSSTRTRRDASYISIRK